MSASWDRDPSVPDNNTALQAGTATTAPSPRHPPKRVVITAGMPYGNKELHFGHVGGMFVHADVYARHMRDRIGSENVLFVSGTDCYGSPVVEYHRQARAAEETTDSLEEFVTSNHNKQKAVLDQYGISPNLFAASGLAPYKETHHRTCQEFLDRLHLHGHLKHLSTLQFYDPDAQALLNGRQVVGRCPVPGCKSEKAYADECALGHPYEPKELIAPTSTLTGAKPVLKEVHNWFLDLEKFRPQLSAWVADLERHADTRPFVVSGIKEFLEPPSIYLKADDEEAAQKHAQSDPTFPNYTKEISKNNAHRLVFENLADRERACQILSAAGFRFRTGKTLVPFRLTGNVEWGVPAKVTEPSESADPSLCSTWWVWPESLIAPVSFTKAHLEIQHQSPSEWTRWWGDPSCQAVQFIGEDNLYFYSLAEMGLFLGMQGRQPVYPPPPGAFQPPQLVVNNHVLFFGKKASSSSDVKPPLARDLLNHYTSDQLRAHFLALSLGLKSSGFKPKAYNTQAGPKEADPVLKEGNLLCNAFNKSVRTVFNTVQKYNDRLLPSEPPSQTIASECNERVTRYADLMQSFSFHEVMSLLDTFLRSINQHWTTHLKVMAADFANDNMQRQALADNIHLLKVATVLLHPIAPSGTATIREMLDIKDPAFWSWERIHDPITHFYPDPTQARVKELPPRFDFFPRHESQIPQGKDG
jgi:methionyl-tRNA synthetase